MPGVKRSRMTYETGPRPTRTAALRRQQTRKGKPRNRMVSVPRNKLAFPQEMKTTLRYCERLDFVPTGTSVIQHKFRANGLYDPNAEIGGHQPRGFDQFMDIYDTFTVLGSKISVSWMFEGYDGPSLVASAGNLTQNRSTSDNVPALTPMICGLHKGLENLAAGTGEEQMEKDRTQWTFINAQHQHKTLKGSLAVSDFFGKGNLVGASGYTGSSTADPDEQILWELWCGRCSNDYPQEATKVVAYVTIEYDTVFTEPKTLNAS